MLLLVAVLAVAGAAQARLERSAYSADLRSCKYDRADAGEWLLANADLDCDRALSPHEIHVLRSNMLYWYEKLISSLHPQSDIIRHCDYDGDGAVSAEDFDRALPTCLHTCEDLATFYYYIIDRANFIDYAPDKDAEKCT